MAVPAPASGGASERARLRSKQLLDGFSSGQRAVVVVAVLAAVVGGYLFMSWASKPTYAPLFTNLQASDAAAITQKLTAGKVPYKLADNGTTISVPQSDVYQERLDLSAAGLPSSSGSGYTLLDKAGITSSDFQQQVEYQQAVQTELDNTIGAMSGVRAAVVHVVIPQQSLFSSTTNQPTASVLLELVPGTTLSAGQVQAIVHLVASSIENLDPTNVTVVDDKGDVLSAPGSNAAALAGGDAQAQQTQQFDQSLNTSLQDYLSPVVGAGNVVVDSAATLDYTQSSTSSKAYSTKPVPVSTNVTKESYTGAAANSAAGGTLGATGAATTTGAGGNSSYTNTSTASSNALSETDTTTQSSPGSLQRLSVAVMLNSTAASVNVAQVKQLVLAATSAMVPAQADTIQVTRLPFSVSHTAAAAGQLKATAKTSSGLINEAVTGVLLLIVVVLLVLALRKLRKPIRTPIVLPPDLTATAQQAAVAVPAIAEPPTMALAAIGGHHSAAAEIGEMIDRDPARVAELLRGWLAEDMA